MPLADSVICFVCAPYNSLIRLCAGFLGLLNVVLFCHSLFSVFRLLIHSAFTDSVKCSIYALKSSLTGLCAGLLGFRVTVSYMSLCRSMFWKSPLCLSGVYFLKGSLLGIAQVC